MFHNRQHAAELLAGKLKSYKNRKNTLVAGLPRGGVVTAFTISQKLNLPIAAIPVKKIRHPFESELAVGAVAPENTIFYNKSLASNLARKDLVRQLLQAEKELEKSKKKFYPKEIDFTGKTIILTDDGIATGATVETAILFLKKKKAAKIILAVPVASTDTVEKLKDKVDKMVVLEQPANFSAVGQFYKEFGQVEDKTVKTILNF